MEASSNSLYMTSWTNVHNLQDENDHTSSYTEVHWTLTNDIEFNCTCLCVNDAEKHNEEFLYQSLSNEELIIQGIPINYYNGDNGSIIPQFDTDEISCFDQLSNYSSTRHWQQLEINDIKLNKKDTGYTKHQGSSRKRFVSRFQDSRWSDQMGQQQGNKKVFYCLKTLNSNLKANDCDKIMQRIARSEMLVETQILLNLCSKSSSSHPNIIQIYGMKIMAESPEDSFIITDYIHELLSDRIERWERLICDDNCDDVVTKGTKIKIPNDHNNVSLSQRLEMALEIASALAFLHDRNMIYFLRPENIGFDTRYDRLKLCQLGQVCKSDGFGPDDKMTASEMMNYYYYNRIANDKSSNVDNKNFIYTPPELLLRQANALTTAVDVYSFGILLWRMITLKQQYTSIPQEFSKFVRSICKNHERPCLQEIDVVIKNESHAIQNLLQDCWDPHKRPNMHIVIEQIGQFLLFQDDNNDDKNNVEVEEKKDEKLMTNNSKEKEELKRQSSPLRKASHTNGENHKSSSQSKVRRQMSDDIVTLSVLRQKVKQETEDGKLTSSPSKKKIRVVTRRSKSSDSKDAMTLQQLQIADDHEKFKQKLVRKGSFRRQQEDISERKANTSSSKPVDDSNTQREVDPSSPSGKKTSKRVVVDSSKDALLSSPLANKTDRKSSNMESPKKSKLDRKASLRRKEDAAELISGISSNPMDSSAAIQGELESSSPSGKKSSKRVDVAPSKDTRLIDHKTNNTDSPKKTKPVRKSSFRRQEDISSKPIVISAIPGEFEPSSPSGKKVSKRVGADPSKDTLLTSSSANQTDHKTSNTDSPRKTKEKSEIRKDSKILEDNSRNEHGNNRSRSSSRIKSRSSFSPVRSKQDNRSESRSPKTSPTTTVKFVTVDATDADGGKPRKSKHENGKVVKSRPKGESSPLSSPVASPTRSKILHEPIAKLPHFDCDVHTENIQKAVDDTIISGSEASKARTKNNEDGDMVRPETRKERCRSCSQERYKSKSKENSSKRSESSSPVNTKERVNVKERIFKKLNTLVSEEEKGKKARSDTTIESSMHSSFIREQNIVYAAMKELVNQEICNLICELEEARVKEPKESRTKSRQPNSDYSEYKPQDVTEETSFLPSSKLRKNFDDVRDSAERSPKQSKRQTKKITSPRGTDKHRVKHDPGSPNAHPPRRSSSTESPRRKTQHRINIQQLAAESPSRLRRTKVSDTSSPNVNAVNLDRIKTSFKQPESPTKSPRRATATHQVIESLHFGSPGTKQKNIASDASIFVTRRVRRNSSLTNFDEGSGEIKRRQEFLSEEQVETFKFHNSFGWEKQETDYFASNDVIVSPSTNRLSSNRMTSTRSATLHVVHQKSPTSRRGSMDSALFSQKTSASRSSLFQTSGMGNLSDEHDVGERVAGSVKRTRLASARELKARFSYFPEPTQSKKATAENEAMRNLQVNLDMAAPITPTTSPRKANPSKKRVDLMSPAKLFLSSGYAAASDSIDFEGEVNEDKAIWEHLVRDRRKSFIQAVYAEGQPTTKITNAAQDIGHTGEKKVGNRFSRRASTNF